MKDEQKNARAARNWLRASAALLGIVGAVLMGAYFAKWWPYAHREDWQFTILRSNGQDFVASGIVPFPLVPCLLLGLGVMLWVVSIVRKQKHG